MLFYDELKPRQPRLIGEVVTELINSGLILSSKRRDYEVRK